jgi:PAS domain S-box-containing protein
VLLAAVVFGRWIGLLATIGSTALAMWAFVPPVGVMQFHNLHDATAALGFVATGLCFVWLTSAARTTLRERDAANMALREGQGRFRTVLESIGEPFYAVDVDWRILHASRAALEIWGRRAEEVIGRRVLEALPEAAGSAPFAALQDAMRTRRAARLEAISGVTKRWVAVDIYLANDGGLPSRSGTFTSGSSSRSGSASSSANSRIGSRTPSPWCSRLPSRRVGPSHHRTRSTWFSMIGVLGSRAPRLVAGG